MLCLGLLTGCQALGAPGERPTEQAMTIRYHSGPGLMNHLELADALGYLEGTGIELDYEGPVAGGPEILRSVATDQTDLGVGPFQGRDGAGRLHRGGPDGRRRDVRLQPCGGPDLRRGHARRRAAWTTPAT